MVKMVKVRKKDRAQTMLENRRAAIHSAATLCQGFDASSQVVWSWLVFFERYQMLGAEGTREDFGPARPEKKKKAKVLKLVPKTQPTSKG